MRKIFNGLGLPCNDDCSEKSTTLHHFFLKNNFSTASNRRRTSIKTSSSLTYCWTNNAFLQLICILIYFTSGLSAMDVTTNTHPGITNSITLLRTAEQRHTAHMQQLRHDRPRREVMLIERLRPPVTKNCQSCRLKHPLNKQSLNDISRTTGSIFPRKLRTICRRLNLTYCHLFERWQRHLLKKQNNIENQNNVIKTTAAVSTNSNNDMLTEPLSSITSRLRMPTEEHPTLTHSSINQLKSSFISRGKRNAAYYGDHRKRKLYSGTSYLLEILPSGVVRGSNRATKYSK